MAQDELMLYDPATGSEQPYPSHAGQWRAYHGDVAWLWNPWSGKRRDARDVGSDVFGRLILPPGERPEQKQWEHLSNQANSALRNIGGAAFKVHLGPLSAADAIAPCDGKVPRGKEPERDQHEIPAFLRRGSD